jgi:oligopeptide/dipeptide ABC transporter ATP-binding protein
MRVGDQIAEVLRTHQPDVDARRRSIELLDMVDLPDPARRALRYPHEFSGGMRQRVLLAMAISTSPRLLIADEPTTALDVTIQAQVLDLLKRLGRELGMATLLVTHDMGVVAEMCDRVAVMYAGRIVEHARSVDLFKRPRHPYTIALLEALPTLTGERQQRMNFIPGHPPQPGDEVGGCPFSNRCYAAEEACRKRLPDLVEVVAGHSTACLLAQADSLGEAPRPRIITAIAAHSSNGRERDPVKPLLQVRQLRREYRTSQGLFAPSQPPVVAVDCVDLDLQPGESLGLVGESGCGKSTLGRLLAALDPPTEGSIEFQGREVSKLRGDDLRRYRRRVQMIYQDPRSSLNRRLTVRAMVAEAVAKVIPERARQERRLFEVLEMVRVPRSFADRFPHELSGGESQRVAIARALALEPEVIIADEAVSSLDVSIKGQILNLLADLKETLGLTMMFISHDLTVVRHVCDRVAVMYLGNVVELGATSQVFARPTHPYTWALRSAVPQASVSGAPSLRVLLTGDSPNPARIPRGCRFHPRCPIGPQADATRTVCKDRSPALVDHGDRVLCACHFAGTLGRP